MTDVLTAECPLALLRALEDDPESKDPFGIACSMFFAGVEVTESPPRALADVERDVQLARERLETARAERATVKKPRRKPNFAGV